MKRIRIPKTIKFPFGFSIAIERRKIEEHGFWEYNLKGEGRIVLSKNDPLPTQYKTLAHELIHAANDFAHFVEKKVATPMEIEMGESISALSEDEED